MIEREGRTMCKGGGGFVELHWWMKWCIAFFCEWCDQINVESVYVYLTYDLRVMIIERKRKQRETKKTKQKLQSDIINGKRIMYTFLEIKRDQHISQSYN